MSDRLGSIHIEAVEPQLDGGRYPVKRVVGEHLEVRADIFKEGHDALAAAVRWRQVTPRPTAWREVPMRPLGNDAWAAEVPLSANGLHEFTVEAWPEQVRSWVNELQRKVAVGREVRSELLEGAGLLEQTALRARPVSLPDADRLCAAAKLFRERPASEAVSAATEPGLIEAASRHPDRSLGAKLSRALPVFVDRVQARVSAWYELFPRSAAGDGRRHGTFADCEALLPQIAQLGFDTLYLPPIHPIGLAARKGKNNSLVAGPDDVGSPWAIGGREGGHKAVHPALGTLADFRRLVEAARGLGLELALDLAFQCSPDHPYVREHPEWFSQRPDGSIKTAENPPKRYEDIVNFDFLGPAREALWAELESVVRFWIDAGVAVFRVDNPHTKPLPFWAWLIERVQATHPEVIFLAEAFTRPKVMRALAKVGFSQSYTYFTWRNFKHELEDYLKELTSSPAAEYMRGNLWPNTPDILPEFLQRGGAAAFRIRLVLAATLSSSYGIYSGFELCESAAVEGTEEYLDSEKYELKRWEADRPGNIRPLVTAINQIRRGHAALQLYRNLKFYRCDNERVLFYGKATADLSDKLLIVVSLDPHGPQETLNDVPLHEYGIGAEEVYQVHELLSGRRALWQGPHAQVQLTPQEPAGIFQVLRFGKRENAFDYFF